jgi:uncharacterized protein (DUF305 family)
VSETVENEAPTSGEPPNDAETDADANTGDDDLEVTVLPWWHNPVNLIVIGIGLVLVLGSLGWVLGNNHAQPDPNKVDVGFLQDMHWHHDQAVEIALTYLNDPDIDPALRQGAEEILVGQSQEIGLMIQMLRDFGEADTNETDTGMAWMGDPTPLDSMPGMASEADLDKLATLSGAEADALFVQLMVAHHQGGIHMADYAAQHANESEVRNLATQIAGSQQEEISELQQLLTASTTG